MDIKKIDPRGVLRFLDELANKVPEKIAKIIKNVLIAILAVVLIASAYYGWTIGKENAPEEGQSLADDTKALFIEDIQREYNRKRRDIRMPDLHSAMNEEKRTSMEYEYSLKTPPSQKEIFTEDKSNLETDKSIRSLKKNPGTFPIIEEQEISTISNSNDSIPGSRIPVGTNEENRGDLIGDKNNTNKKNLLIKREKDLPKEEKKIFPVPKETETIEEKGILRKKTPDDEEKPATKKEKRNLIKKGKQSEKM